VDNRPKAQAYAQAKGRAACAVRPPVALWRGGLGIADGQLADHPFAGEAHEGGVIVAGLAFVWQARLPIVKDGLASPGRPAPLAPALLLFGARR